MNEQCPVCKHPLKSELSGTNNGHPVYMVWCTECSFITDKIDYDAEIDVEVKQEDLI